MRVDRAFEAINFMPCIPVMTEEKRLSIAVSCILFTLADADPATNKYCTIFLLWLSQLIRDGGLRKDDGLYIALDNRTFQYLNEHTCFGSLITELEYPFYIRQENPPIALLQGMLWKYDVPDYSQDAFLYCDIDILILKDIHSLLPVEREYSDLPLLLLHHEDSISNPDYGGVLHTEQIQYPSSNPGFSAGKFICIGKEFCKTFCSDIKEFALNWSGEPFYTIEQPFFNKLVYSLDHMKVEVNDSAFLSPRLSMNGHDYEADRTVLLDCMGMPGNGDAHFKKILDFFTLLHCTRNLFN
jgi:hypothetical protein